MIWASKIILRVQRWSIIGPGMRRRMLMLVGCKLHPTSVIRHSCWLSASLEMGADSHLNMGAFVDGSAPVVIEDGARIGVRATILTQSHQIEDNPSRRSSATRHIVQPVRIGRGSWVGASTTILPGANIGSGCVIGAGSVVTRPTAANGVYVGSGAARRIRDLPA